MDRFAKQALNKGNIEVQVSISKAEVQFVIWKITAMWQEGCDGGGGIYTKFKEVSKTPEQVKFGALCTQQNSENSRSGYKYVCVCWV